MELNFLNMPMKKSKILFILDEFYPIKGAPAIRINSFIQRLSEYQVSVLGGSSEVNKDFNYLLRPSEKKFISFVYFLIKINVKSFLLAKKNKPETIVLSIPKYELLFVFPFLKRFTCLLILDIRDSIDFIDYTSYFKHFFPKKIANFFGRITKKMINKILIKSSQKADVITVANQGIANSLPKFKNKISLISNGVDVEKFKPLNKQQYDGSLSLNIVYVGNFAEKDKFDWIYKIFPKYNSKVTLNLVGGGRNKNKVLAKLKKLKITVKDYGFVEHSQIPAILNKMDLGFIFREEGVKASVPVAIFEFAAMNIPTITNGVGIMADFVKDDQLGWVVSNPNEFKEIIRDIINNPNLLQKYDSLHTLTKKKYSRKAQAESFVELIGSS